jgi:hypothetical protein
MQIGAHDRADLAENGILSSAGCGDASAIAIFGDSESLPSREIESTGIRQQLSHILNPLVKGTVFRRQDTSKEAKCDQAVTFQKTFQASHHR